MFQSTRPRGARRRRGSITRRMHDGFNPRARAGRDVDLAGGAPVHGEFQSTRPRGARQAARVIQPCLF